MNHLQFQLFRTPKELRYVDVLDEMTTLLLTTRYFQKLRKKNPVLVRKCAQFLELTNYKSGDVVFKYGDKPTNFYLVIKGQLDLSVPRLSLIYNVRESSMENLSPQKPRDRYSKIGLNFMQQPTSVKRQLNVGDFFGEQGLLTHKPRLFTVVCTTDVMMLELGKKYYEDIINDFDLESDKRDRHTRFTIQLFSSLKLNNQQMLQIFFCFEKHKYLTNQFLFQEGDGADCIFIVKTGEIILLKDRGPEANSTGEVFSPRFLIKKQKVPFELAVINNGFVGEEFVDSLINEQPEFVRTYSAQCKSKSKIFKLTSSNLVNMLQTQIMKDFFVNLIQNKTIWRNDFLDKIKQIEPKQLVKDPIFLRNPLNPLAYRQEMTNQSSLLKIDKQKDVIRSKEVVNDFSPTRDVQSPTPLLNMVILSQMKKNTMNSQTQRKELDISEQHTKSLARMLESRRSPTSMVRPYLYDNAMRREESPLSFFCRNRFRDESVLEKITVAAKNKLCSKNNQKMNAQEFLGIPKKQTKSIFQEVSNVIKRMKLKLLSPQALTLSNTSKNYTKSYASCRQSPQEIRGRTPIKQNPQDLTIKTKYRQSPDYINTKNLIIVGQPPSSYRHIK